MARNAATAPPSAPPELRLALTTVSTRDQALNLAERLIERRLAACVQLQAIESVYRWEGQVQQEAEWRLLIKTTAAHWTALCELLAAEHPYALPALLALPVSEAEPRFADWLRLSLAP